MILFIQTKNIFFIITMLKSVNIVVQLFVGIKM